MSVVKRNFKRGFTLVELLVTISIFVILTGIVLFNQGKFDSTILLTNLAYDTALTVRQAQTYGINVKEFDTNKFFPYGVHFETGVNNKSFILFADPTPTADVFSGNTLTACINREGCVNRYNIQRGNKISKLCVDGDCAKTKLDIVFQRPNPDAIIFANGDSGTTYNKASIYLTSADSVGEKEIDVQSNGLIQILNVK